MRIDLAANSFQILVVGDCDHSDFHAPLAFLADVAVVHRCANLDEVLHAEGKELRHLDLIILAQSRPGQISVPTVDALHHRWPLTPIVGLLGSWCEGEMRSGQPWPGVVRVYWHQWQTMLAGEVEAMLAERSAWQRPRIMHQAEGITTNNDGPRPVATAHVVVHARQPATRLALVDGLVQFGMHVWHAAAAPQASRLTAVVYDAEYADHSMLREIVALRRAHADIPLLALLSFPRRDDVASAIQAGAGQVMSKPYRLQDVVACINDMHLAGRQHAPTKLSGRAG